MIISPLGKTTVKPEIMLENCSLVASITGTAGMEALFYEKPSLCFTDTFYSHLSSVTKVENMRDLPSLISNSLSKKISGFLLVISKIIF